jgi:hypothetical protein
MYQTSVGNNSSLLKHSVPELLPVNTTFTSNNAIGTQNTFFTKKKKKKNNNNNNNKK